MTLFYPDHIVLNFLKINRGVQENYPRVFATGWQRSTDLLQGPEITGGIGGEESKNWISMRKIGNISEREQDTVVSIECLYTVVCGLSFDAKIDDLE